MAFRSVGRRKTPSQSITRLRDRHRIIAALAASGWTGRQIAKHLRMTEGRVSIIINSPVFVEYIRHLRTEVKDRILDANFNILDAIDRDAKDNFRFIRSVREDEDVDTKNRLRASLALLARQAPVAPAGSRDLGGLHIHLGGRDMRTMAGALREAKAIEGAEAEAIDAEFSEADD